MFAMEMTPMMQQYLSMKEEHKDAVLFFRMGDFYEMFFDDAKTVSRELSLTLTSRSGDTNKAPMCGVPYHAADSYIEKLVKKGYKVAIAEQVSDPKAKGLTERKVIKVITAGTIMSESVLKEAKNNYLSLVAEENDCLALASVDVSTGECFYGVFDGKNKESRLMDELYRTSPAEILETLPLSFKEALDAFIMLRLPQALVTERKKDNKEKIILEKIFPEDDLPEEEAGRLALLALLGYLRDTVMESDVGITKLTRLSLSDKLMLDTYTLRNLEITRSLRDGSSKGTLFYVLDKTNTAMGSRLLRNWLEAPLLSPPKIEARLDAVEEMTKDFALRGFLRDLCKEIYDFPRILTKVEMGTANARDLLALKTSLEILPKIKEKLSYTKASILQICYETIEPREEVVSLLERSIREDAGISLTEGGIIKDGYSEELDEYRNTLSGSKENLQRIEEREREQTGIRSLKIGYNKVFGYYIEVRSGSKDQVPQNYVRKQTLANAERFVTEELKEFETKILGAREKIENTEYRLFTEVRDYVKGYIKSIRQSAWSVAVLDVLLSLGEVAVTGNYVRPKIVQDGNIKISDGRHPIVERILDRELYVPNDTDFSADCRMMLITGPNMAGKSTYMRQVALITLMAQAGSFVPARDAFITPVDRIFTRIGASDDLISGESTFMVEMKEVAQILKYATARSLIVLDEVGRGTSTFDGMSIAKAVIEHIDQKIGAKTLFATHYHELTEMENEHIKNFCVAVKERGSQVDFLRRIVRGAADKSYGIHVARLAGLPPKVTKRAQEILQELESGEAKNTRENTDQDTRVVPMDSLFSDSFKEEILKLDIMSMTPIEALNELYKLQERAKKETGKA